MDNNELLANRILAATPALELREAAVVALHDTESGDFHTGRTYAKDAAFGQATRIMTASDVISAYVVYRHAAGVTIYLSKDTVLHTVRLAA